MADMAKLLPKLGASFHNVHGFPLDLANPSTFSEFMNWRKLFANFPTPSLGDKLYSSEYAGRIIGFGNVPKIHWFGTNLKEFRPDSVVPGRYMLKANHGSGFVRQLTLPDDLINKRDSILGLAEHWMNRTFGNDTGEWWYSNFQRYIFVEEFLGTNDGATPDDFKFYCFNGTCEIVHVDRDRFTAHKRAFYDRRWQQMEIELSYPTCEVDPPANLIELLSTAEKLAMGLDFVRVDLYNLASKVVFGELTLTPGSGLEKFKNKSMDKAMGKFLSLHI